jgi:hypothetical protein
MSTDQFTEKPAAALPEALQREVFGVASFLRSKNAEASFTGSLPSESAVVLPPNLP